MRLLFAYFEGTALHSIDDSYGATSDSSNSWQQDFEPQSFY